METPPIRSGDYVGAMRTIAALNEKIGRIQNVAGNWVLKFDGKVVKDGDAFGLKLTFGKPNNTGFIETVSAADVAFYANDPEGLIDAIADKIILELFKRQIRDSIAPFISRSISNAAKLSTKS